MSLVYIILSIPWALFCWLCVVIFGKYKTAAFRLNAVIVSFFVTPLLGILIANRAINKDGRFY